MLLFRHPNLKHICPLVVLVKNLRNFKIEYLILTGLDLKSSKIDPHNVTLKLSNNCCSKSDPQLLLDPQTLLKIWLTSVTQKVIHKRY